MDWAADLADAELEYAEHAYDCVVLDRGLPDGDGLGLLRRWRTRHERTPTLVLTALDALPDRIAGFTDGADDYLVKPLRWTNWWCGWARCAGGPSHRGPP